MFETYECWHCGNPQWVCEAVHFWKPVLKGLAWAVVIGLIVGVLLRLIYNPGSICLMELYGYRRRIGLYVNSVTGLADTTQAGIVKSMTIGKSVLDAREAGLLSL